MSFYNRCKKPLTCVIMALALLGGGFFVAKKIFVPEKSVTLSQEKIEELGSVKIYQTESRKGGLLFLITDEKGWTPAWERAAQRIARKGYIVAGVEQQIISTTLDNKPNEKCHWLFGIFDKASRKIQATTKSGLYFPPVFASVNSGSFLAAASNWQALSALGGGAYTVNFAPQFSTKTPLCNDSGTMSKSQDTITYADHTQPLTAPWKAIFNKTSTDGQEFAKKAGATVITVSEKNALAALVKSIPSPFTTHSEGLELGELHLAEHGPAESTEIAIFYSGDGGWRAVDVEIAEALAKKGMRILGVDCLQYFWHERKPQNAANDLEELIKTLTQNGKKPKILLIGYSFGADILPPIMGYLSPEAKKHIVGSVYLSLAKFANYQISVSGFVSNNPTSQSDAIDDDLKNIAPEKSLCIYGIEEKQTTGCLLQGMKGSEIIERPGSHHFDGNYVLIAEMIYNFFERMDKKATAQP